MDRPGRPLRPPIACAMHGCINGPMPRPPLWPCSERGPPPCSPGADRLTGGSWFVDPLDLCTSAEEERTPQPGAGPILAAWDELCGMTSRGPVQLALQFWPQRCTQLSPEAAHRIRCCLFEVVGSLRMVLLAAGAPLPVAGSCSTPVSRPSCCCCQAATR